MQKIKNNNATGSDDIVTEYIKMGKRILLEYPGGLFNSCPFFLVLI